MHTQHIKNTKDSTKPDAPLPVRTATASLWNRKEINSKEACNYFVSPIDGHNSARAQEILYNVKRSKMNAIFIKTMQR